MIEVRTPALRERRGDIPLLAASILARLTDGDGRQPQLTADALAQLMAYEFPGNVRELENVLERAITLSDGASIGAADLQLRPTALTGVAPAAPAPVLGNAPAPAGLDTQIEQMEKRAIRDALEKARYNKTRAAELLGLSFRQLRYKLKKFNIE